MPPKRAKSTGSRGHILVTMALENERKRTQMEMLAKTTAWVATGNLSVKKKMPNTSNPASVVTAAASVPKNISIPTRTISAEQSEEPQSINGLSNIVTDDVSVPEKKFITGSAMSAEHTESEQINTSNLTDIVTDDVFVPENHPNSESAITAEHTESEQINTINLTDIVTDDVSVPENHPNPESAITAEHTESEQINTINITDIVTADVAVHEKHSISDSIVPLEQANLMQSNFATNALDLGESGHTSELLYSDRSLYNYVTVELAGSGGSAAEIVTIYHQLSSVDAALQQFINTQSAENITQLNVLEVGTASAASTEPEAVQPPPLASTADLRRKRLKQPNRWKRNTTKADRQSGKLYTTVCGKEMPAKTVKICLCHHSSKCRKYFGCPSFYESQQAIHNHFWSLNDDEKGHFYARTTERVEKKRSRVRIKIVGHRSRRNFSYKYFFHNDSVRVPVCSRFYLDTLNISAKRIEYFHAHRVDSTTSMILPIRHGKHTKKRTSDAAIQTVVDHINSFQRIQSHYCRASSTRQYLDSSLSIEKMYNMYCDDFEDAPPVKLNMYKHIFVTQFNLSFRVPKKDKCDCCEEYRTKSSPTDEEKLKFDEHEKAKIETKNERDRDRHTTDKTHAVICFDLENVISLPRANIKSFFFRRKLSVFNLTAHCSVNKQAYCAIWHEGLRGRSGNDLASALIAIMHTIVSRNEAIKNITLWSDACVAQNKNSIMSYAILQFLADHPHIDTITQKFGTPGHSPVQEVDSIHSVIEQCLRKTEVHSPIGLLRILNRLTLNRKKFNVIEMTPDMFKDYQSMAKLMQFTDVPFTKVCQLQYTKQNLKAVSFVTSFENSSSQTLATVITGHMKKPTVIPFAPEISSEKAKDIGHMLKFMDKVDKAFYKDLFHITPEPSTDDIAGVIGSSNDRPVSLSIESKSRPQRRRAGGLAQSTAALRSEHTTRRSVRGTDATNVQTKKKVVSKLMNTATPISSASTKRRTTTAVDESAQVCKRRKKSVI